MLVWPVVENEAEEKHVCISDGHRLEEVMLRELYSSLVFLRQSSLSPLDFFCRNILHDEFCNFRAICDLQSRVASGTTNLRNDQ